MSYSDVEALIMADIEADLEAELLSFILEDLPDDPDPIVPLVSVDTWTEKERVAANLDAMTIAASKEPDRMTAEDKAALFRYSGWGGIKSLRKQAPKFPAGFPVPEKRGLIHEYYTPTNVCQAVSEAIRPLIDDLPMEDMPVEPGIENKVVVALEPSAGIGRFVNACLGEGFEALNWHAVEWSELSGRMLQAMRPEMAVFQGPFERWIREQGPDYANKVGLVLANPPYGARGSAIVEDPWKEYREKAAYKYFLRRGLDMLASGGLGVYLIPAGFVDGSSTKDLRRTVLKRHHLSAAFRLPSGIFPGANLVTDLLFFRARGGELPEVPENDQFIVDGRYFIENPDNILGEEKGKNKGEDDQTKKPRWGYEVVGKFTGLPTLHERPMCKSCPSPKPFDAFPDAATMRKKGDVVRRLKVEKTGISKAADNAVSLGARVDAYLKLLSAQKSDEHVQLWGELIDALKGWVKVHGNPHRHKDVKTLIAKGNTAVERFLTAYTKAGKVIAGLLKEPEWTPRYGGKLDDLNALAEFLYRTHRTLTLAELKREASIRINVTQLGELLDAGWCLDGRTWGDLLPTRDYLSGHVWDRYDRVWSAVKSGKATGHAKPKAIYKRIVKQYEKLAEALDMAVYEEITGISPVQGWVPLDIVSDWVNETYQGYRGKVELIREDGIVQVKGRAYEDTQDDSDSDYYNAPLAPEVRLILGWMNHDKTLFRPKKKNLSRAAQVEKGREKENAAEARQRKREQWEREFLAYVSANDDLRATIEDRYNRNFRGWLPPTYSTESMEIARWDKDEITLYAHQEAGARRLIANRGGLLSFDVGVGKTFTACAVLARARQEGWVRRPVVLVPATILWKWKEEIEMCLPDYRVAVIGAKLTKRGSSVSDTPEDRARKWSQFQAGEYDVVVLSYDYMARVRMNEDAVVKYCEATTAIQRTITLQQRNANKKKEQTEREEAVAEEGVRVWVSEVLELPAKQAYDPGIAWDDIGVDMLIVDEAQNFKNLYMPETREGSQVPRFMGSAGKGSKRAWQLDFRSAAVRELTGGSGIVLLSATPVKNSPLEFYSMLQYIDHDVWTRMGIYNPEQFIERYLDLEIQETVNIKLEVVSASSVVGFKNLHELRDVIFRFADFKIADEVGLILPESVVNRVPVEMDDEQEAKYDEYIKIIEDALSSDDPDDKGKAIGYMTRLSLVAVHPDLDDNTKVKWKDLDELSVDPHSPKFDAVAAKVVEMPECGHLVFVENPAAHFWLREVLVDNGIDRDRIGILNADVAKASMKRNKIAKAFNGDPKKCIAPDYDVLLVNSIAYEGINLQTRTCALHHIDLPYEPSTLQQRNGRGVRQGNLLANIEINYYMAERSSDGHRFNLINGKLNWMNDLIRSTKRDTNNPGAQQDLSKDEMLLMISRDPEKTKALIAEVEAQRQAASVKRINEDAARTLRTANARFRKAEAAINEADAYRNRHEGEALLDDLASIPPEAWGWIEVAKKVREHPMLIPTEGGPPVYEGMRLGMTRKTYRGEETTYYEFGRLIGMKIGRREVGRDSWMALEGKDVAAMKIQPDDLNPKWPADDVENTARHIAEKVRQGYRWDGDYGFSKWLWAPDKWLTRVWKQYGEETLTKLRNYQWGEPQIPAVKNGKLVIVTVSGDIPRLADVVPPTNAGWKQFLKLAPESGLKWTPIKACAEWWWKRKPPRGLLVTEEDRAKRAKAKAKKATKERTENPKPESVNLDVWEKLKPAEQSCVEKVMGRTENPGQYTRQSVRFPKDTFTPTQAIVWLRRHGIKPIKPMDRSTNQLRYRLREPEDFEPDSFVTLEIANGVQFVSGHLKPGQRQDNPSELDFGDQTAIQLLVPRSKFTPASALDWATERGAIPLDVELTRTFYRLILVSPQNVSEATTGELVLVNGVKVIFGEVKRTDNPLGLVNVAQLISAGAGAAKALGALVV